MKFAVVPYNPVMRFSLIFLLGYCLATSAQTVSPIQTPKVGPDGVYEVAAPELSKLDSSPKIELPRELSAFEVSDKVVVALTVSPEGKVIKARAVSGRIDKLKQEVEKTVKRWAFQPVVVNGTPVFVRSEITFDFDNTFDHYRDPDGDVPVHLDEKESNGLIVKTIPPHYPPDARLGRIQGPVQLRVIVGKDGHVQGLHIIKGHPLLAAQAYNAVRGWEFKPYAVGGRTVPVDTYVTVNFSLSGW